MTKAFPKIIKPIRNVHAIEDKIMCCKFREGCVLLKNIFVVTSSVKFEKFPDVELCMMFTSHSQEYLS